jgi:hypothetical protein
MEKIEITPRKGTFAGRLIMTDRQGYGIFTRRPDGTLLQHTGTGQTPKFRSAAHLGRWLRKK